MLRIPVAGPAFRGSPGPQPDSGLESMRPRPLAFSVVDLRSLYGARCGWYGCAGMEAAADAGPDAVSGKGVVADGTSVGRKRVAC